ncbi:MAG: UPF0147 family protein [Candidatus Woesearchaeota archaeon]
MKSLQYDMTELIEALSIICDDDTIPKNVKAKLNNAMSMLNDGGQEAKIRANKALQELDDISDDPNIPTYVRPQIWNVVSMLEGV